MLHVTDILFRLVLLLEDPANNFLPDTGEMTVYRSGSGNGIRLTVAVHMSEPLYHHTMTVCL